MQSSEEASNDASDEAKPPELFGTETMAELCARQGRLGEAIRIYRHLLGGQPEPERAARWSQRCESLERARAHASDIEPAEIPAPVTGGAAPVEAMADTTAVTTVGERFDDDTLVTARERLARDGSASGAENHAEACAEPPEATPRSAAAASTGARSASDTATPLVATPAPPVHQLPLVITQPVRSGQVVYARHNDLIALAPVNSGAQVVADGNIHIYGPLRGRAIAGAQGCPDARIFCQRLEAELLAINGIYLVWEDIPPALLGKPAQISLRDGVCIVAPL